MGCLRTSSWLGPASARVVRHHLGIPEQGGHGVQIVGRHLAERESRSRRRRHRVMLGARFPGQQSLGHPQPPGRTVGELQATPIGFRGQDLTLSRESTARKAVAERVAVTGRRVWRGRRDGAQPICSTSRSMSCASSRPSPRTPKLERKTLPGSLGFPLGWPLRSGGQAPEADALSTELQARGPR